MSRKIKAYIKQPGKKPYCTYISNTLDNLQRTVGGYIETVTIANDCVIICNEEGRLLRLPHNCEVCSVDFVGPIIFLGIEGENFGDVPMDWERFKQMFPDLFEVGK